MEGERSRGAIWGVAALVALVLLVGAPARAAENGLKVGEGRLHPFFEIESRYDSLAGYVGSGETSEDVRLVPVADLILHFRPGLRLDVPSEVAAVAVAGNVDYALYTGIEDAGTREQSRLQADADLGVTFNPNGAVYVHLGDHFARSDRTSNLALGVGTVTDFNEARFKLGFQPGGKALVVEPGYTLAFEHFEQRDVVLPENCTPGDPTCDPSAAGQFDYLQHTAHLDARWKFLPKTAVVFDGQLGFRGYLQPTQSQFGTANLKTMVGLTGLVSTKVALTAKAGWGDQLAGSGYKSVIGQLELAYLFSEQAQTRVGYVRTFEPSPGPDLFFGDDRAYLDVRALLGGRLTLHGHGAFDYITFGTGRVDSQVTASLGPDYEITDWLNAGIGYQLGYRESSDDRIGFDYVRHEAFARVQVIY